jgi:cyclic pyranopterin phosphate synthase
MAGIPGIESIGLSTNGTRLETMAGRLKAAGLRTVNISLDALDGAVYRRITGGDVKRVLGGIRAALGTGFDFIKLNCVLLRGLNETELWPLVLYAAEHRVPLRLIELMPFTRAGGRGRPCSSDHFMPIEDAMHVLSEKDELIPQPDTRIGWGPAKYYSLRHSAGAMVGFIGSLTDPHFCETCNKMRLTADGKIRPCLGAHGELDLRELRPSSDEAVRELLLKAISRKPLQHGFRGQFSPSRPMTAIGG